MANAIATVGVEDPTTATNQPVMYGVLKGPQEVTWQQIPANNVSNAQISINTTAPAMQLIDRRIYLQIGLTINFTGSCPGGNVPLLNLGGTDGLRAYPLLSITDTLTMKFGSTSVTLGPASEIWPAILRYQNDRDQRVYDGSIEPCMFDQMEYSLMNGTNRNPLAPYGTNTFEITRGAFNGFFTTVVNPAPAAATNPATGSVTVLLTSPLYLPPFIFHRKSTGLGLYDVNTFNFSINFGDLTRVWSRYNIPGGSSIVAGGISVTINSAQLLYRQLKPNAMMSIPPILNYPYFSVDAYPSEISGTTVTPGEQVTLTSNANNISGIPRRAYIWVGQSQGSKTFLSSDIYFSIQNVQLLWNGKPTLVTASPVDIYEFCVNNGLQISWPEWNLFQGSILCIDFGRDLGLGVAEAPGLQGKQQLQVKLLCTNIFQESITPTVNIVCVQEGVITLKNGFATTYTNVLDAQDVLSSKDVTDFGALFKRSEQVYGGDFFGDFLSGLKNHAQSVLGVAKQALPLASLIPHPAAQAAAHIGQQYLPVAEHLLGSGRSGGARVGGARPVLRRRVMGVRSSAGGRRAMYGHGLADQEEGEGEEGQTCAHPPPRARVQTAPTKAETAYGRPQLGRRVHEVPQEIGHQAQDFYEEDQEPEYDELDELLSGYQ